MVGYPGDDNWVAVNREIEASEARAAASPTGLADEIEQLRKKYGAGDYAWVDIVEQNLPTILKHLRKGI